MYKRVILKSEENRAPEMHGSKERSGKLADQDVRQPQRSVFDKSVLFSQLTDVKRSHDSAQLVASLLQFGDSCTAASRAWWNAATTSRPARSTKF